MAIDFNTTCEGLDFSLSQMLASTIVGYHDVAGILHYRLNFDVTSGLCENLSKFPNCGLSHIDPEHQLVENVFELDDCFFMALKAFNDSGHVAKEYEVCAEMPQTLIQMLARSIVTYQSHNRLNMIAEAGACTTLVALLNCNTNAIDSERLLVQNVFGLDNCNNLGLKIFSNSSTFIDYHTLCAGFPESFIELLARCIVLYDGKYMLNTLVTGNDCGALHAFWTCINNNIEPDRALAENVFAVDACGNLALKLFVNAGEEGRPQ